MTSEIRVNKLQNRVGLGTVEFSNTGIVVSGIVTATELSGLTALNIAGVGTASTLDINGDIDVDGHTNLDNVSIAGVSTFTGNIDANGALDVNGTSTLNFIESIGTSGHGAKLGGLSVGYDSLYATIQPITGDILHLNYNAGTEVRIGASNTKVDLDVNGDVYPKLSGNRDLGLSGKKWRNVYGTTFIGNGDFVELDVDGHTNLDNVSVGGATTCQGGAVFMNSISLNASTNNYLYFNDNLNFTRNGHGNEMIIDSNGKIGINTVSPGRQMHIFSGTSGHPLILERGDGSNTQIEIRAAGVVRGYWGSSSTANFMVYDNDTSDIHFEVLQDGNVHTNGLGTFEFNNGWSAEGRNVVVFPYNDSSNWFSFVGTGLRFTDGGNFVKPSDNSNSNWGNIAGVVFEGSNNGTNPAIRFVVDQPGENGSNYSLGSGSSGKTAAIDNNTALFISGNGQVKNRFTSNNGSVAEGLFINNMYNGTGNNASLIFSNDSGERKKASISYIDTGNYGTGDMAFCLDNDADSGELHVTNHERMRITKDGNVGINENSPDNRLHIKDSNPFIELEGTTNNSGDVGIFLNANGNHWLLRADNYPSQNAFSIKSGTVASSTHRFIVSDTYIDTGSQTITGGTNLALQNFRVKGVWSGSPSIGKSIELISGYDSAVKLAAIGYNLTDVNLGSTYGGDLTFHTQPLYSSPQTPIPERMRISSSGYITKSVVPSWNLRPSYNYNQTTGNTSSHHAIGWSADSSGNGSTTSKATFLQNCTLHGSGWTYNLHNGQNVSALRVPVAGRYYVNVTYRVENNPNQGNIYVYVAGSQIARQHVEMWAHRPYMHCQWASVLNLAKNDEIIISISCPNATVSGRNDNVNWFSGYLIG